MQKRPWLRGLIIIICLYLIVTTIQAMFDLWKAGDKELSRQKRLSVLINEQQKLLAEKNLAESQPYWEKIARDQLGMSKNGEQTLIISDELLQDKTPLVTADPRPNWKKWVDLLL